MYDPSHAAQAPARVGPRPGDSAFRGAVFVAAGLVALALFWLQFCPSVDLPAKPPRPESLALASDDLMGVARAAEANPIAYAGFLERDSERYGIEPPVTVEDMGALFPYRQDDTVRALELDQTIEVAGLSLTLGAEALPKSRDKRLIMTIENPGDTHVAFNVVTEPMTRSRLCNDPPAGAHNALALAPGETVVRTECWYHPDLALTLRRVEVMELSPLSYHYVSHVPPETAGVAARLAAGHQPPSGRACTIMLSAQLRTDLEAGRVTWRDVIDYYARHRCETYRFPGSYRAFDKPSERDLPVVDQ